MKIKHQRKKKQQAKEICHEQEKRDEEQQQLHQGQRRQDEVCNACKVRKIEEASFYSYVENLKDLASVESKKDAPVISIVKDTQDDLKQQLDKCKQAHNANLMLVNSAEMRSETSRIGNLQRDIIEVGKTVGVFLQKQE